MNRRRFLQRMLPTTAGILVGLNATLGFRKLSYQGAPIVPDQPDEDSVTLMDVLKESYDPASAPLVDVFCPTGPRHLEHVGWVAKREVVSLRDL